MTCPKCKSENITFYPIEDKLNLVLLQFECLDCGEKWRKIAEMKITKDGGVIFNVLS
jgi:Zn ribbon nucleic-acid-binding protein